MLLTTRGLWRLRAPGTHPSAQATTTIFRIINQLTAAAAANHQEMREEPTQLTKQLGMGLDALAWGQTKTPHDEENAVHHDAGQQNKTGQLPPPRLTMVTKMAAYKTKMAEAA